MENILVLGATGNIGLEVLKALKNSNANVYAGIRNENNFDKAISLGVIPKKVDFTIQSDLDEALKDMDRVFLVTPLMQNPEYITQLVVNSAKKNKVKHLVRSTALGADINGQIEMARWAGRSEEIIKESGLNYTFIRPNNFLQNFINFHSQTIKEYKGFYLPNGDAKAGMVAVEDIAETAAVVMNSDKYFGQGIDLSGLALTNEEYAKVISDVTESKVSYIDVSENKAKESMLSNGMPEWLVNAMMELNYVVKQGWTAGYSVDFKNITGKEYTSAKTFFETNKSMFI